MTVSARGSSRLLRGEFLSNRSLTSPSGRCTLENALKETRLRDNATGETLWKAPVRPDYGSSSVFALGLDGDLTIWNRYRAPLWNSGTAGCDVEALEVRDDGLLALVDRSGELVWSAGSGVDPTIATPPPASGPDHDQSSAQLQRRLEVWIDSLVAGRGYSATLVEGLSPAEVLRRCSVPAPVTSTWEDLRTQRDDENPAAVVIGAVTLGRHTLLLADRPWFDATALSAGARTITTSRAPGGDNDPGSGEWTMHRDGVNTAHFRADPPIRRRGARLPELSRPLMAMGSYDVAWTAGSEGLELMCRVAGVSPTAADLGGAFLGAVLDPPAGLFEPPTGPVPVVPPARPVIPWSGAPDDAPLLLIRTDYEDDDAWAAVVAEAARSSLAGDPVATLTVSDPGWAAASVDEVLAALPPGDFWEAVFVADAQTMTAPGHPLLAVSTSIPAPSVDYEPEEGVTREFRATADTVADMHVNFQVANMSFEEFSTWANDEDDKVYRGD